MRYRTVAKRYSLKHITPTAVRKRAATLVDELFGAEAKCQVYGSIHSFLHSNTSETSDISEYKLAIDVSSCM